MLNKIELGRLVADLASMPEVSNKDIGTLAAAVIIAGTLHDIASAVADLADSTVMLAHAVAGENSGTSLAEAVLLSSSAVKKH